MMKMTFVIVFLFFMVASASGENTRKPYIISAPLDYQVREIFEGVVAEAYQRLGYTTKIILRPAERSLRLSNSGEEVDAELGRAKLIASIYPSLRRVPVPIGTVKICWFSKSLDFTKNKKKLWRIAAVIGIKEIELFLKQLNVDVIYVRDSEQLFRLLNSGRVDLAISELYSSVYTMTQLGMNSSIYVVEPPLKEIELFHYIHKKHEGVLMEPLTRVLSAMKASGELMQLGEHRMQAYLDRNLKRKLSVSDPLLSLKVKEADGN